MENRRRDAVDGYNRSAEFCADPSVVGLILGQLRGPETGAINHHGLAWRDGIQSPAGGIHHCANKRQIYRPEEPDHVVARVRHIYISGAIDSQVIAALVSARVEKGQNGWPAIAGVTGIAISRDGRDNPVRRHLADSSRDEIVRIKDRELLGVNIAGAVGRQADHFVQFAACSNTAIGQIAGTAARDRCDDSIGRDPANSYYAQALIDEIDIASPVHCNRKWVE